MRGFERGEHLVEVAASLGEGQAAQAVVAAELTITIAGCSSRIEGRLATASLVVAPLVP